MNDHRTITPGLYGYMESHERTYQEFLAEKILSAPQVGFDPPALSNKLYPFQSEITRWACLRGRAAIFADCGIGKTPIQLEWAQKVKNHTKGIVLIVAPLAVSEQTLREAGKFSINANICKDGSALQGVRRGIFITNYERLHLFDPLMFSGIVLDESSILKSMDGKRRNQIIKFAQSIHYRLACTATPAPNDFTELCNHAEFLDIMSEKEVKALFFTQDGNSSHKFRLKGHAQDDFWKWVASWAVAIRNPSDLGYTDSGYAFGDFVLPSLRYRHSFTKVGFRPDNELFDREAITLSDQRAVARQSLNLRSQIAADVVNASTEPFLVWCNLNDESKELTRLIPDAVEIKGSDSPEHKTQSMIGFCNGDIRVLVTKPKIAGFGMNFQHCNEIIFVGLSHSFEQLYQATRRCWRFGQTRPVTVHIIDDKANARIVKNIERKERNAAIMMKEITMHMNEAGQLGAMRHELDYQTKTTSGENWTMHLGDCVDVTALLEDESIGLSVFSPPFPGMYVYSNSTRDMGNTHKIAKMIEHMRFMVRPLLTKTMPGRHCCIHLTQGTAQKIRDGHIGIRDFRGAVINLMESEGWIYYGEVAIDKNPQVKAVRTKDRGLLFKTLAKDSSHLHMALADYLLQFRKPGDNPEPIHAGISKKYQTDGWITSEEWIRWARPGWYAQDWIPPVTIIETDKGEYNLRYDGISETNVLNVKQARETNDERHLAPLQLSVIERAVKLWSAPGDTIYSPYAGIGSEGVVSIQQKRCFVGAELKLSYFESACRNLRDAYMQSLQGTLFAESQN